MALSLGLALALNQALRGISWIRTMYFLPLVTSAIAVGLVWAWIYSPTNGLLNQLLHVFGIPAQKWVSDPFWAMPSIIAMSIWQGLPANTIIFLAGLQAIPADYYDAASVDGAGRRSRFRHVTLPLLTPSLFFTGILSLIGAFQVFDQVFVLSRPGQADGSDDHDGLLHLRERVPQLQDGLRERGLVGPVPHRRGPDVGLLPLAAALGPLPVSAGR